MFMSLLLLPGVDEEGAEIRVDGPPLRYPDAPRSGDTLADVLLDIRMRSGMLALLGNRTRVKLHHRRIQPAEPPSSGRYIIDSEVDATVFLLGMPLKRRCLRSLETVQAGMGLISQRMNFADGSYSIIALVP